MASELIYRGHDAAHTPTSGGAGYTPKPEKRLLWFSRPLRYLIREQRLAFLLVGMALATLFFALAPSSSPSSYSSAAAAELALRSAMELARFGEHHRHRAAFEAATSRGFVGGKVPLGIKRKGLRIVVTGGAGFVGSHLVDRLIARGDSVIVVDNFFTGRKENVMHHFGNPNFELIRHDVVEPLLLEVDQIYHLACPASPVHYKFNPVKTIKTNVVGTLNMLGLAKRVGARFLLTSTSEVYGDPLQHPQVETYWGNVNPIGWVATWNLQVDPFHKECLTEWNGYLSCTWQALLNKLPTIDNMKRRGIYHVNRCSLCLQQEETVDHLYFACNYTKWIWKEILQRFELNRLPQPNLHQELGDLMQCFSRKGPLTQLAKVTFRCAIWWMWKERCNRIFECQHTNNAQLLKEIIRDSRSCMEHDLKIEHFTRREKDIFIKFNFAISYRSWE